MKIHSVFLCLTLLLLATVAWAQNNPGYVPPQLKQAEPVPVQPIPPAELPVEQGQVTQQPQNIPAGNAQAQQIPPAEAPIVGTQQQEPRSNQPFWGKLTQYPVIPQSAVYSIRSAGMDFSLTLQIFNPPQNPQSMGFSSKCSIDSLQQKVAETTNMIIDKFGNVLQEQSRKQERTFGPAGQIQVGQEMSSYELSVTIEDNAIFGANKVIRYKNHNSGKNKEFLVGVNDPVTSYLEIFAWIGTLRTIPQEGMIVRFIFNGRLLPIFVRSSVENVSGKTELVYTIYPAPELKPRLDNYLFKFVYPLERINYPNFMFPEIAIMNLDGKQLPIYRQN